MVRRVSDVSAWRRNTDPLLPLPVGDSSSGRSLVRRCCWAVEVEELVVAAMAALCLASSLVQVLRILDFISFGSFSTMPSVVHLAQWPACRGRKGVPAMEQVMHLQFLIWYIMIKIILKF